MDSAWETAIKQGDVGEARGSSIPAQTSMLGIVMGRQR